MRSRGLSLRDVASQLGVSKATVQRDTVALSSETKAFPLDAKATAMEMLRDKASEGNVQAILRLEDRENLAPCRDHISKAEHDAALEEVFSIVETNFGPVSGLAKFVEVKVELTDEISHTAKGIRRTYEARAAVRRQLSGVVEAEPAPVKEPYSLADLKSWRR